MRGVLYLVAAVANLAIFMFNPNPFSALGAIGFAVALALYNGEKR